MTLHLYVELGSMGYFMLWLIPLFLVEHTYSISHYKSRMVTFLHFVTYLQHVMCYWYEIHIKMILNFC